MDPNAAEAIRVAIDSDETLIWADRPDTTLTLLYPLLLFLFLSARLYLSRSHNPMWLQQAIAAAGFFFLLSWFLNRHTFYGLTTRRAVMVLFFFSRTWTRSSSLVNRLEAPILIRRGFLGRVTFGRKALVFSAVAHAEGVCEQARAAQQRMLAEIDARAAGRRAN